jgi:hypothetical protein
LCFYHWLPERAHHVVGAGPHVGHVEHLREGVHAHVHDLHRVVGVVDVGEQPDRRTADQDVRKVLLRLLPDKLFLRKPGINVIVCL